MCVSITPDQLQTINEMYPDHLILAQVGAETIGWTFDGTTFTEPE